MRYKIGDTVKIKSFKNLLKTLGKNDITDNCGYNRREMAEFSGMECTVDRIWNHLYELTEIQGYVWTDKWLEDKTEYLPEELFEL